MSKKSSVEFVIHLLPAARGAAELRRDGWAQLFPTRAERV